MAITIDARYPLGPFALKRQPTDTQRCEFVWTIADIPMLMRDAVRGLNESQIDTPYREGGWTVRQVVHHVADSHLIGYSRLKFALTEDNPTVKPFSSDAWAALDDYQAAVEVSLTLLDAVHARWQLLFRSLKEGAYSRPFVHPEHGTIDVDWLLQQYAWHGRHHIAQITSLRDRLGW